MYDDSLEDAKATNAPLYDSAFESIDFIEDAVVTEETLPIVIKIILRNLGWAKLEYVEKFFVHFGYDFYMYIGTWKNPQNPIQMIEDNGLHIITRDSPHGPKDQSHPTIFIERSKRSDDIIDDGFRLDLNASHLTGLKKVWQFSEEHPFYGAWEITPVHSDKLQSIVTHKFDLHKYYYWLTTDGDNYLA